MNACLLRSKHELILLLLELVGLSVVSKFLAVLLLVDAKGQLYDLLDIGCCPWQGFPLALGSASDTHPLSHAGNCISCAL